MPTYEYRCQTCGIHFERRQRMADEPLRQCPECEGPVQRVLHPVGIVFKGSGWYCTDHRSGSSSAIPPKGDDGKAEKTEGSKSEAKADTKVDTKADKPSA